MVLKSFSVEIFMLRLRQQELYQKMNTDTFINFLIRNWVKVICNGNALQFSK